MNEFVFPNVVKTNIAKPVWVKVSTQHSYAFEGKD